MPKIKIDDETRAKVIKMYYSDEYNSYKEVARDTGLSAHVVANIIKLDKCVIGAEDDELDRRHAEVMCLNRQQHAEMTTWMEHVTPLHQHKLRLEAEISAKQEALDKAKQEYRNFLATVKQLMEDTT